ncbi:MAG: protein kinase [Planctomycetes bacterium]|nr:protein kinase [Planctomycetota bacterium]
MSLETDLTFGLLALQMGFVTKEKFLESASLWFNDLDVSRVVPDHRVRGLDAVLRESGFLSPEGWETVGTVLEAQGSEPPAVDSQVREALLELSPPSAIREWLFALPARKGTIPAFRPEPSEHRYQLREEIARGGLGRVVEAIDRTLEREVAIKLVLEEAAPDLKERFVREARLAARLDHPNIVPIFDFGETAATDGGKQLFLCMKRIRGQNLGQVIRRISEGDAVQGGRFSRARLLRILQDVCLGIAFAHSKGVVHRDLKPSNVMIGDFGETLIVDWGLAKLVGEAAEGGGSPESTPSRGSPEMTMEGDVVGTPAYMPPEQAAGRRAEVDHRSDIFALGGILYAILTHRPPFEGGSHQDVLQKVMNCRIDPPSIRVRAIEVAGIPQTGGPGDAIPGRNFLESVPPELDAICLKAMAFRREDRFQSATEMHDEIQLFLEGVKELERRRNEAREHVEAGRRRFADFCALKDDIEAQERVVADLALKIPSHQPIDAKRPLWEAEARLRSLRENRIRSFSEASAEFGQALAADAACSEAADGKCDLFMDQFLTAERKRDSEEMLLHSATLSQFDRGGKYRARLEAPGKLSIRTWAFACDCLKPRPHSGWRVEIEPRCTIPWRDGRPRPDLPLTDGDFPVPAVTSFPEGVRWGHAPDCRRLERREVEVSVARYEERDKRLVLGPERLLGLTPLAGVELPQGSWRCVLRVPGSGFADVLLPVRIDRGGHWSQDVTLIRSSDIPEGFCYVPGGPFLHGGAWAGGPREKTVVTEDLLVAKFPSTCAEYLEFLNDLCSVGGGEEARKRQPREGDKRYWREVAGGFRFPTAAEDPEMKWAPDWPVFSINWFDAVAFAAWKSKRDGVSYRLLHEVEFQKVVRGVDGRVFSFGDTYDGCYAHKCFSLPGGMRPLPVGSFPVDESPFGVRDVSGGMATWCWNTGNGPYRGFYSVCGGAWSYGPLLGRAAGVQAFFPETSYLAFGIRLALTASGGS